MKILSLIFFVVLSFQINAQQIFKGKVIDDKTNNPLENVSVRIEGSKKGITTDSAGMFQLPVMKPGKIVLLFSSVGYGTIKKAVTLTDNPVFVEIRMTAQTKQLDEVTVVGTT